MTDAVPESGAEVVEQGTPTPTFTEPSPASSTSVPDAKSLAKEVAELLRPDFEKLAQSAKDKRFDKIEKQMDALGLSELQEMGVEIPENVQQEMRIRALERRAPVQEVSRGSGAPQNSDEVSKVINELQLDANTPEVIRLLSGQYRNLDHFRAEASMLKMRQLQSPQPNPAAAPAMTGGGGGGKIDPEALYAKKLELYRSPTKNKAAIAEIDKQLKEAGQPVD